MAILAFASALFALAVLPLALYLGLIAVFARRAPPTLYVPPSTRFAVVVPAHNEAVGIAKTVANLRAVDYPSELFDVFVVADNCSDDTAPRAKEAGARVLVRHDPTRRGKGYALEVAFEHVLSNTDVDAVVVVDADTTVSPNLLRELAAHLALGARAVQVEYGVQNPDASWRTRLLTVALAMFHRTRSLAREHWGVSCGLRGNGMCFSRDLLVQHPHKAYGLVEDVEYGITLGLASVRVAYGANATVYGEMVSGGAAAKTQRQRWEHGRRKLRRNLAPKVLRAALGQRSVLLLDLLLDLLVPPLSTLAVAITLGLGVELAIYAVFGFVGPGLYLWGMALAALLIYVLRGVQHAGLGFSGLAALAYAPVYVAWKLIAVGSARTSTWIRTRREAE